MNVNLTHLPEEAVIINVTTPQGRTISAMRYSAFGELDPNCD